MPKFKKFNGFENENQHIAHFWTTYENTWGNDILLTHLVNILSGVIFDWYSSLPDDSLKTFAQMDSLSRKKFASVSDKNTI